MTDITGPATSRSASCVLQSALACAHDPAQVRQLLIEMFPSRSGDGVWLAAILRRHRRNPATLFQPRNRAVQSSRAKAHAREALDVLHHGVAVLIATGKAGKNEN